MMLWVFDLLIRFCLTGGDFVECLIWCLFGLIGLLEFYIGFISADLCFVVYSGCFCLVVVFWCFLGIFGLWIILCLVAIGLWCFLSLFCLCIVYNCGVYLINLLICFALCLLFCLLVCFA